MRVIRANDVNEALPLGLAHLRDSGQRETSRAGLVVVAPEPVATVYSDPRRRVLFDPVRNANPFFHLIEALWILCGRNDVKPLVWFNKNMANYSDDKTTFHAPYGFRLRHAAGFDQIAKVVNVLRKNPQSRQAALSIWDPRTDLGVTSKDIPCNDMVFFRMRPVDADDFFGYRYVLDMTVANRSNDAVWGAYGANAVQFSVLQEYLASALRSAVGTYTQVSHNFHVYEDNPYWQYWSDKHRHGGGHAPDAPNPYMGQVVTTPLVAYHAGESFVVFEDDLRQFNALMDRSLSALDFAEGMGKRPWRTEFFKLVREMVVMWGTRECPHSELSANDWLFAGSQWVTRANARKEETKA